MTASPFTITANNTTVVSVDYEFAAPTITQVTQSYAFAGQYLITITGTGFASDGHTVANIDGVPCTGVTITSGVSLQCTVPTPHAAGFVSVTVTTSEGTTAASSAFQYEYWSVDYFSLNQTAGDAATQGGMVVGPDNNIWFTDRSFGLVGTVDNLGNITECALPANSQPVDIAAGTDGNLWVTDYTFDVIYSISPTGFAAGACNASTYAVPIPAATYPQKYGGHPYGITSGPDGNIWFTQLSIVNGTFDQIGIINVTTDVMSEFTLSTQAAAIFGIASGPDNRLWFAYDTTSQIGTITISGTLGADPVASGGEYFLTSGPDGNIWYTSVNGGFLGMVTVNGIETPETASIPSNGNIRITSDARGAVWYSTGSQLGRFDTTLLKQRLYPVAASSGVAVGPDGTIWSLCQKPSSGANSICRLHF